MSDSNRETHPTHTSEPHWGTWRTASYSDGGSNCVEVAIATDGRVGVRDSKDRTRAPHIFTPTEWAAFLAGALAGEFTPERLATHP
ncbi:MAG: DUF397 domain-containing protein [Pseudonocardia sp.]